MASKSTKNRMNPQTQNTVYFEKKVAKRRKQNKMARASRKRNRS